LLAFETIPSVAEAKLICQALDKLPSGDRCKGGCWISFSCRDERHTCYGDLFADAVQSLAGRPGLSGIGVNCTAPRFVSPLLKSAAASRLALGANAPYFVVYPNGTNWCWPQEMDNGLQKVSDGDDSNNACGYWASSVPEWAALGAEVIGGCCGSSPEDISAMADACRLLT